MLNRSHNEYLHSILFIKQPNSKGRRNLLDDRLSLIIKIDRYKKLSNQTDYNAIFNRLEIFETKKLAPKMIFLNGDLHITFKLSSCEIEERYRPPRLIATIAKKIG